MPELPEVETVRRGLYDVLVGAKFTHVEQRRPDLRFPLPENFAARLEGQRVEDLTRRAKYLLAELESGEMLAMHLGMSGRFTIEWPETERQRPGQFTHDHNMRGQHDHIVFHMSSGATVRYNDVRRFGFMDLVPAGGLAEHKHFCKLGVEPLGPDLTPRYLAEAAADRRTSLKAFLMDQHIIAGLGNIYVCEALYRAGLSPQRVSATLARKNGAPSQRAQRLTDAVVAVLRDAIEAGGSTLRDYQQADGSLGYFQHAFAVYGREGEPCPKGSCAGVIARLAQNGRSTFYCPRCQR